MNEGIGTNSTRIKRDTKLISISSVDLNTKANYQDFQRFQVIDVQMAGDAEATLRRSSSGEAGRSNKSAVDKRGEAARSLRRGHGAHARGGCGRLEREPISTARMCMEVYGAVKDSTGRSSPPKATSATGRTACGRSRNTTTGSGAPAATAWATARRPRSARRSPTRLGTLLVAIQSTAT